GNDSYCTNESSYPPRSIPRPHGERDAFAARRLPNSQPCAPSHFRHDGRVPPQLGRFILQVVGTMVFCVSTLPITFQPQPVFSSSNGWSLASGPRLAMYIGWKNWWSSARMKPSPPLCTLTFMPSSLAAILPGSTEFASWIALTSMFVSLTARG